MQNYHNMKAFNYQKFKRLKHDLKCEISQIAIDNVTSKNVTGNNIIMYTTNIIGKGYLTVMVTYLPLSPTWHL